MKGSGWLLAIGLVLALVAWGGFVMGRLLDEPAEESTAHIRPAPGSAGLSEGVAELLLRQAGLSQRDDPIVISAAALSDFLARHLEARRFAVRPRRVRVGSGWVELAAQSSPRQLLTRTPAWLLPGALLDIELWIVLRGRVVLRDGHGELAVEEAAIGRQRVPARWVWWALGTSQVELLRWRMPRIVERVELEPGRLILYTRRRGA